MNERRYPLEHQGPRNSLSLHVRVMEERVEVRKERVAQEDGVLHGSAGQRAKNRWVLGLWINHVLACLGR